MIHGLRFLLYCCHFIAEPSYLLKRKKRFLIILSNMQLQLTILISILLTASAVNWQAADNITQSNRTFIWDTINNNIASYAPSHLEAFSSLISTALNQQWDPAWNVIVTRLFDPSLDVVLYGYAFKNHWMWFNGFPFRGDTFSFVIWKDYNCLTWNTIANNGFHEYYSAADVNYAFYQLYLNALTKVSSTFTYEDIWSIVFKLVDKMNEQNPSNAFSAAIVSNGLTGSKDMTASSSFNGRVCSAGGAESFIQTFLSGVAVAAGGYGGVFKVFIFKTR